MHNSLRALSIHGNEPPGRTHRGLVARTLITVLVPLVLGGIVVADPIPATATSTVSPTRVPCSGTGGGTPGLIAAIKTANLRGGGSIQLAPNCTYTLVKADNRTDGGNGLPVLRQPITISGGPSTAIARASTTGTPTFRIAEVAEGATANITGVKIIGGRLLGDAGQGGGILNEGDIGLLDNDSFWSNSAAFGAAVANIGTIGSLSNSTFAANTAGNGGGLINIGTITNLTNDTIRGNAAGIGGGITNGGTIANLGTSDISDNRLVGNDGGVGNGAGGGIANNFGRITMSNDLITGNTATSGPLASGGGIESSGTITMVHCVVQGNEATGVGGGIKNEAQADPRFVFTVRSSAIVRNTVTSPTGPATGGAIYNEGALSLAGSTVLGNRAVAPVGRAVGAAIYNAGSLILASTSVGMNTANDRSGEAEGGGVYVDVGSKKTTLSASTVTGNLATGAKPNGGGIFYEGGAKVVLTNSGITGNRPQNCYPIGSVAGCQG